MNYYISDTHFGDNRIIELCRRPFKDLDEMTNTISRNWNSIVEKNDSVYIVGDFAMHYDEEVGELIDSLNGMKTLIPGNHDRELLAEESFRKKMNIGSDIMTIEDSNRSVTLCHYPMLAFEGSLHNGYHIYGHIHNNYNEPNYNIAKELKNCFNAGVDVNDFTPKTLDELIARGNAE